MSPTLNKSSVLQRFECGNVVEICNHKMFDFLPGTATYTSSTVSCIIQDCNFQLHIPIFSTAVHNVCHQLHCEDTSGSLVYTHAGEPCHTDLVVLPVQVGPRLSEQRREALFG